MSRVNSENPYFHKYDLSNCDSEPLKYIQTIQGFSAIIGVRIVDMKIIQTSSNVSEFLPFSTLDLLDNPLSTVMHTHTIDILKKGIAINSFSGLNPIVLPHTTNIQSDLVVIAHLSGDDLILEIEKINKKEFAVEFINKMDEALLHIQSSKEHKIVLDNLAKAVKDITEYDRVMVYRFDEDYNGEVVAESKELFLEPYLGLHYPASDIPAQARALYRKNRIRMIADVFESPPMMVHGKEAEQERALDFTKVTARGVSPIHLEYLGNMGVHASLSCAIIENDTLWGLIACHHYQGSKELSYQVRNMLRFMAQIVSGHLSLVRANSYRDKLLHSQTVKNTLFEQVDVSNDLVTGLLKKETNLMNFIESTGVVLFYEDKFIGLGEYPDDSTMHKLVNMLNTETDNIYFSSDNLSQIFPEDDIFKNECAGLMSVKLSKNEYIMWFRAPIIKEVLWGGNPEINKEALAEKNIRLSPRKSFETWKQVVKNKSAPWTKHEHDTAIVLRNDITEIILKRFDELRRLHLELQNSYQEMERFSYSVSHDLKSPLRAIEGYSQILIEDYEGKLDEYGISVLKTIVASIDKMNIYVESIINITNLSKRELESTNVDSAILVDATVKEILASSPEYDKVMVEISSPLPAINGDEVMINQLFQNVISNAIKYSSKKDNASVKISAAEEEKSFIFLIEDNGIGIEKENIPKIFTLFRRLVPEGEYEGNGIGMSIVQRILERNQATIDIESKIEKGTIVKIIWPK